MSELTPRVWKAWKQSFICPVSLMSPGLSSQLVANLLESAHIIPELHSHPTVRPKSRPIATF